MNPWLPLAALCHLAALIAGGAPGGTAAVAAVGFTGAEIMLRNPDFTSQDAQTRHAGRYWR